MEANLPSSPLTLQEGFSVGGSQRDNHSSATQGLLPQGQIPCSQSENYVPSLPWYKSFTGLKM